MKSTRQQVPGQPVLQRVWYRLGPMKPALQGFYLSLGFHVCGDESDEDGIAHMPVQM